MSDFRVAVGYSQFCRIHNGQERYTSVRLSGDEEAALIKIYCGGTPGGSVLASDVVFPVCFCADGPAGHMEVRARCMAAKEWPGPDGHGCYVFYIRSFLPPGR